MIRIASIPCVVLLASAVTIAPGCANTQNNKSGDPQELRNRVASFHRFLRWEKFQRAAEAASPGFQNTFLGRYDAYDGEVDILRLKVKSIDERPDGSCVVEVEQQWYSKDRMTVQEGTFVEIWSHGANGWRLENRLDRKEWEARQESNPDPDLSEGRAKRD